jgi:hypothetical protein
MRKVILTLMITQILTSSLLAQKPIIDYQDAVIFKKNNDSIKCKVELVQVSEKELDPLGETFIRYKLEGNEKLSMKTKDIQSIKLAYCTYLNVPVDKQELLFKVAIKGKISLLEYPRISIEHFGPINGGTYKFGPKVITYYAIMTNNQKVVIKLKKDLNAFKDLIEGCPEAKAIADKKIFQMDNLPILVNKLNACL